MKSRFAENVANDGSDEHTGSNEDIAVNDNLNQHYTADVGVAHDPDLFQLNQQASSLDRSSLSETPVKRTAYVSVQKPIISEKDMRIKTQDSNSIRRGSSFMVQDEDIRAGVDNTSPVNRSPEFLQNNNFDISAHMDEAPVSKARTVTNLLSVTNKHLNALSKMSS